MSYSVLEFLETFSIVYGVLHTILLLLYTGIIHLGISTMIISGMDIVPSGTKWGSYRKVKAY